MSLTPRGRAVVVFLLLTLVVGPVAGGYVYGRSIGFFGDSEPGRRVSIRIPNGSSAQEVGEILEDEGVIDSALGFRLTVLVDGGFEDVQAGRYELVQGLTARDALAALTEEGPLGEEFETVTFPEGFWLTDFATALDETTELSGDRFLEIATSGKVGSELLPEGVTTLEGMLFPSTYQVVQRDTERIVVERLLEQMESEMERLDFTARADALGVTPYEALIVASMIEAEAAIDADRDKISRVIYNRLEQGIMLGIDATVLYALGEHKEELTVTDLAIDSPYNTRQVAGLPPTPIGAPGSASLEAAVALADGDWVYYVLADCEGHHAFSVEYSDFLEDKAAYQTLDC